MRASSRLHALLLAGGIILPISAGPALGCAERLGGTDLDGQLECLAELRRADPASDEALETVTRLLDESDETTDPRLIAAALDVLRAAGPEAHHAAEVVSALLPYRSPLYRNRDKLLVVRLRAYVMATLADIGCPPSAMPALVDSLVHVDDQSAVLDLAAAARAAGTLGPDGSMFVPYLIEAIPLRKATEEVSLERFASDFPRAEATTVQLEAVHSLGRVATPDDREAIAVLRSFAESRTDALDPRLVKETRMALERILEGGRR